MALSRGAAALVTVLFVARPSLADDADARRECSEAYVSGQHLMREGKLLGARKALLVCARAPCAASIQPECSGWLGDVERALPSIVLAAHDAHGKDLVAVSASLDGQPLATRLDGIPVDVDPGPHVLRVEALGHEAVEESVVIREGEKARLIRFELHETGAAAPIARAEELPPPSRLPAYVVGGVGVAAAATFAYFGIAGLVLRGQLASCKGMCAQSRVDTGNADWTGADASLGVAVVSLGVATYLFVRARPSQAATSVASRFLAAPTPGGAVLGYGSVF